MAKNKREFQAELEAANKRIAGLSQSNQNANSNINNDEPPWLKTFLEAQLSMQRQSQGHNVESQRQMQQIIERFSQQQLLKERTVREANHVSKRLTLTVLIMRQDELKRTHKSLPHCRYEFR